MRRSASADSFVIWSGRSLIFTLFLLFLWSLVQNLAGLSRLDQRLIDARNEVAILKQVNQQKQVQTSQFKSGRFDEIEIRNKLGLVKPGEVLVIVPERDQESFTFESENMDSIKTYQKTPLLAWIDLFL